MGLLRWLVWGVFVLSTGSAALAQQKVLVGRVLDADTRQGVNRATVMNKRTQQKSRTNAAGRFQLMALPGDSIIATSLTHARVGLRWDGTLDEPTLLTKRIAPDIREIDLPEVTVMGKHEEELRRELERVLQEPVLRETLDFDHAFNRLADGAGITLLYELFSRRAKSDRKAAMLWQQYRWDQLAQYRLRTVAGQATDLSGDKLEEFMTYCRFDTDFLLRATDYELTYEVLQQFKKYNSRLGLPHRRTE